MMHRGKLWSLLFIQVSVIWQCEKKTLNLPTVPVREKKNHSASNVRRWQVSLCVWCHVFSSRTLQQLAVILVGTPYGRSCELLRKYSVLHCCDYIRKFVLDCTPRSPWSLLREWNYVERDFTCLCWSVLYNTEYSSWWPAFWQSFCTFYY